MYTGLFQSLQNVAFPVFHAKHTRTTQLGRPGLLTYRNYEA